MITSHPLPRRPRRGGGEREETLGAVASSLSARAELPRIVVEGHTDVRGVPRTNRAPSRRRAQAVADELVARGVPADRIEVVGAGESRPLVRGARTEAEHARNRRVEIHAG